MIIYGVNTSHDTSLAIIDDGVVVDVFEEERSRREKYFNFKGEGPHELLLVHHKGLPTPDELIFASFDRRQLSITFDKDLVSYQRPIQDKILEEFTKEQLTMERIDTLMEEYPDWGEVNMNFDPAKASEDDGQSLIAQEDFDIMRDVSAQFEIEDYFYENEHHLYHAESGYTLSPWKDEPCIAIVWDGGGAQCHFEIHPNYQEIESIYRCEPNTNPKAQWKRYSNHRFLGDLHSQAFGNYMEDCFVCPLDLETEIEDVPTVLTSKPSMGMNFSNASSALGCDDMGRAAGKVMGMASYGSTGVKDGVFNQHTIAQELELQSLEHSCTIIQRAIDLNPDTNKIILSGGFSLNCTNNYKYLQRFPNHQIFVDPVPHDGGTAVGAASILYRNIMEGSSESTEEGEENVAD